VTFGVVLVLVIVLDMVRWCTARE